MPLSCWCVGRAQGTRRCTEYGRKKDPGEGKQRGYIMSKAFKGVNTGMASLQLKAGCRQPCRQFMLKRWMQQIPGDRIVMTLSIGSNSPSETLRKPSTLEQSELQHSAENFKTFTLLGELTIQVTPKPVLWQQLTGRFLLLWHLLLINRGFMGCSVKKLNLYTKNAVIHWWRLLGTKYRAFGSLLSHQWHHTRTPDSSMPCFWKTYVESSGSLAFLESR